MGVPKAQSTTVHPQGGGRLVQPNERRPWPRHFKDRLTSPLPTRSMIWKILREGGFGGKGAEKVAHLVPRGDGVLPKLRKGDLSVTWVGHATTLVRLGGLNILTDPVWTDKLPGPRSRRMTEPGLAWDTLPKIDAVVISHDHYDHLDAPTLRRLPKDTPIFVGANTAQWFHKRGYTMVYELDWWESAELDGVRFTFTPAHHWCRRGLRDVCRRLWGSWVLESGGKKVFFGGDTGYGTNFSEIGNRLGPFDVAILPIGAYDPRWFMKSVHTDPAEAVQACADLRAKRMVGMHWGTFVLTREPFLEPLEKWREEWAKTGRPKAEMWDLALGETRVC
jgi:L-ascorbate metabolism protein UlaG (beta-lactamase superfamily)